MFSKTVCSLNQDRPQFHRFGRRHHQQILLRCSRRGGPILRVLLVAGTTHNAATGSHCHEQQHRSSCSMLI